MFFDMRFALIVISFLIVNSFGYSQYCASSYSNTADDWITNVTFNTINNTSGQEGVGSYGDYTGTSTSVTSGQIYNLSVSFISSTYTQHVFAFIDWNQDLDFDDSGEAIDLGSGADATLNLDITIPISATPGNTRMRIIEQFSSDPVACDVHSSSYGETEDYTINIIDTYCTSSYSDATFDWITNVTFNTINNTSGQDGANSLGNYTSLSTSLGSGQTYNLSVSFVSSGYTQYVSAFFDWNQDNDFDDAGETFDLGSGIDATLNLDIPIPATATYGTTRMRIIEQYNISPGACDAHPDIYGETEDYSIVIQDPYCISTYSNTGDDWMTNVTFNTINNTTGQDGSDSYGDYTATTTSISTGQTYNLSVSFSSSTFTQYVTAFIDWNQDFDFDDTDETQYLGSGADATLNLDITVPAGATLGNTRMRIIEQWDTQPTACNTHPTTYGETEDYTLNITSSPMAFVSSTTTQNNINDILANTTDIEIIGIEVVTSGATSPFNVTEFDINMNNTTSVTDASDIHVYYTGTSSTFATISEFNTATPATGTITITGSQELSAGTNYFWIAYDIGAGATVGNYIDAECTEVTMDGGIGAKTPTVTAPSGLREIVSEINYIVDFDGLDDRVEITHDASLMPTNELTVEAWIKADNWETRIYDGTIINKERNVPDEGYMFRVGDKNNDSDGGDLNFTINIGGSWYDCETNGYGMATGVWYHVAGTYDGIKSRIYINGEQVDSLSIAGTITANNTDPFRIGGATLGGGVPSPSRYFDGQIEDARVWSKALTTTQIQKVMHQEIEQDGSNVVGSLTGKTIPDLDWNNDLSLYIKFNTATGLTAYDQSTQSNDGTIVNGGIWNIGTPPTPFVSIASGSWDSDANWNTGQNAPIKSWAIVKTKHDLTLTSNESVKLLIIDDGKITTGANSLSISSSTGAVERRELDDNCFVEGNLRKIVTAGAGVSRTFEVGTEASGVRYYSPTTVTFSNVSVKGKLTGKSVQTTQPNVAVADETMKRYWDLTNEDISFDDYTANFKYNSTDFNTSFTEVSDEATMVAGKYDYISETWSYPNIGTRNTANNECEITGVTSFSGFTFGKFSASLPIELLSFNSKCFKDFIELTWITASEINNDFYSVEKSYNAEYWTNIGYIKGAGNSNITNNYSFIDYDIEGRIFYRLKQTDYDGNFTFSDIVISDCKNQILFHIKEYYTTRQRGLHISVNSDIAEDYSVQLIEYTGKEVFNNELYKPEGIHETIIYTSDYSKGVYLIIVRNNKRVFVEKVIIK